MRLLKKWEKINYDKDRMRIDPYRSFYLRLDEIEKVNSLPRSKDGEIISSIESEELLKEILSSRNMEILLYPELERQDWSGFVKLFDDGLFWML